MVTYLVGAIITCQDGDVTFVFVSGDLALDFVGTRKWRQDAPEELLTTPDDAARWAVEAGLLTEAPSLEDSDLRRLRELREAVYRLVSATLNGRNWDADDVGLLNVHADSPPPRFSLAAEGLTCRGDASSIAWAVSRAAAELLAHAGDLRLRECDREGCTRIFIDRSRTGNRRWCGMEECGNRIKAAHYRARKSKSDTVSR
jgi:predicted RNA-binding Zn ribbon-like protein